MNMQQMMIQAQKMQRELNKALDELHKKEFSVSKNGIITVTMLGNKEIKSISIDEDAFDKDSKDMVEEILALAINELITKIDEEEEAINSKIAGRGGLPF